MLKRLLITGGVTLMAALLLIVTMRLQPPQTPTTGSNLHPGRDYSELPIPTQTQIPADNSLDDFKKVDMGKSTFLTKTGQMRELFWQELRPRAQGVLDVVRPGSRVFLRPNRVIQILANTGQIVAPENNLRSGQFRDQVVITFFDAPGEQNVNLAVDSPHIQGHVFIPEARFDVMLGQIVSDPTSPVHVTSPAVDFHGTGLNLMYNEPQQRLERLEVLKAKSFRFKPETLERTPADSPPSEANHPQPAKPHIQKHSRKAVGNHAEIQLTESRQPTQWYRATLTNNVRIETPDMAILADQMEIVFTMDGDQQYEKVKGGQARFERNTGQSLAVIIGATDPLHAMMPLIATLTMTQSQSQNSQLLELPPQQSLLSPDSTDIIITLDGPMIVLPEPQPPTELVDDNDTLVKLTGQPIHITTTDHGDVITAATATYIASSQILHLIGSKAYPMTIESPQRGTICASGLALNQQTGTGRILGAGHLKAYEQETTDLPYDTKNLSVDWKEHVDLVFSKRKKNPSEGHDSNSLTALRSATFHGDVAINHPRFNIQSDTLTANLSESESGQQTLSSVAADGHVQARARSSDKQELDLKAGQLQIKTTTVVGGQAEPMRLIARENILAVHSQWTLRAGFLDVSLGPDESPKAELKTSVRSLLAKYGVRINYVENNDLIMVMGHNVTANVTTDHMELFGKPGELAHVIRPNGMLSGQHIVMDGNRETVNVPGPGTLKSNLNQNKDKIATVIDLANVPDDPISLFQATPNNLVTVTWTKSMDFDNTAGLADFRGTVHCNIHIDNDKTKLTCEDSLQIHLTDSQSTKTTNDTVMTPTVEGSQNLVASFSRGDQSLERLIARQGAKFLTENWTNPSATQLNTRLQLEGPVLIFEGIEQRVRIPGTGTMLFQDHRTKHQDIDQNVPTKKSAAAITGKGATVFTWDKSLLLDGENHQMVMEGSVRMVHQPQGANNVVQLDGQRLQAKTESTTGGIGAVLDNRGPTPRITEVTVDETVRVLSDHREILADHLRYTSSNQQVIIWCDKDRLVKYSDEDKSGNAKRVHWELDTDSIVIDQPGGITAPMRR